MWPTDLLLLLQLLHEQRAATVHRGLQLGAKRLHAATRDSRRREDV